MKRIEFEAEGGIEFQIKHVGRALYINAWDLPKVRIDFFDDADSYEQKGKKITLSSANDCIMRVPADSSVVVGTVEADATLKGFNGALTIQNVGGSLNLKRLGEVAVSQVRGNLTARDIQGNLTIDNVMGNASIKNVEGDLNAREIKANFDLKGAGKNVVAESMGNANVRSHVEPKTNFKIKCMGNAYCKLDNSKDLSVALTSHGEHILVHTELESQTLKSSEYTFKLGDGSSNISIEAGGLIDFQSADRHSHHFDFNSELDDDFFNVVGDISDQINVQLVSQLESLESQLESLSEHIQGSSTKSIQKAQRKVEQAQRNLEQRMQARGPKGPRRPIMGLGVSVSEAEPVSEEERMKVLEMVQEKKITVEEAEVLLATLEGRKVAPKKKDKQAEEEK